MATSSSLSSQTFTKIIAFSLLSFTLFSLMKRASLRPDTAQNNRLSFYNSTPATALVSPAAVSVVRTGIINELGIMSDDFVVREFDEGLIKSVVSNLNVSGENEKRKSNFGIRKTIITLEKLRACDESSGDFISCFSELCSEKGVGLDCLLPWPKGYKLHVPQLKSSVLEEKLKSV